jgi:hypothetical protein
VAGRGAGAKDTDFARSVLVLRVDRGPTFWCKIRRVLRRGSCRCVEEFRVVLDELRAKLVEFTFILEAN